MHIHYVTGPSQREKPLVLNYHFYNFDKISIGVLNTKLKMFKCTRITIDTNSKKRKAILNVFH